MVPHSFNPSPQGKWRQVVSSKPTTGYIESLSQKKRREKNRKDKKRAILHVEGLLSHYVTQLPAATWLCTE